MQGGCKNRSGAALKIGDDWPRCPHCEAPLQADPVHPEYPCPNGCWMCACGEFWTYFEACELCDFHSWDLERPDFAEWRSRRDGIYPGWQQLSLNLEFPLELPRVISREIDKSDPLWDCPF